MAARVAVVGGGWSGLACAVELADAGRAVTVFEAGAIPGGRARRVEDHSGAFDNGQHLLLGAYHETLAMIHRVQPEARADSLYVRSSLALAGPGRFLLRAPRLPAPLHTLVALLAAQDCTLRERLAVLQAFVRWQRCHWQCARNVTVETLLRDQPPRMIARLWQPLCIAALNTPPRTASAQIFLNVLRAAFAGSRADSDLIVPIVDLSRLFPEPAARHVAGRGGAVRLRAAVRRVAADSVGWVVESIAGTRERFDRIVVATGASQACALLEGVAAADPIRALLQAYRYEPITTVYLEFAQSSRVDGAFRQLGGAPGQWVFAQPTAQGGTRLAVVISTDGPHRRQAHADLIDAVLAQLRTHLPAKAFEIDPLHARVITERRATHASTPDRRHPKAGRIAAGLYLAGDHTDDEYPATLEAAVRAGRRAAAAVLDRA